MLCHDYFNVMLSVIMMSVIMLSVIMLSVIMLSVIMLSVIMLSVIMLSVMAPKTSSYDIMINISIEWLIFEEARLEKNN